MKTILREIVWWVKKTPVTTAIVLLTLSIGIATKALWLPAESSGLVDAYGWGLPAFAEGKWWTILVGAFIAPEPWMYLLILPLIILGGGYIEYKYGAVRMLVTLFATHIASVAIVSLFIYVLQPMGVPLAVEFAKIKDVGMSNAGFGAIGVGTAALATAWRKRVRSGLFLYSLAFALFSGLIWDFTHMTALLVGFAIGPLVIKRPYEKPSYKLNVQEKRNLVAQVLFFNIVSMFVTILAPVKGVAAEEADATNAILLLIGTAFLGLMAYGTYAGRKFAWRVILAFNILSILVLYVLARMFDFDSVNITLNLGINLILFILLIVFKKAFNVVGDKYIRRSVYRNLALVALAVFVSNALVIYAFRGSFAPEPDFGAAVVESVLLVFGISTGNLVPQTAAAEIYTGIVGYIWVVALFIGLGILVFNTLRARDGRGMFDSYDKLLHESGSTSIGWMARWQGMSYWVNLSKTAGFAYRLENNFAIILSDPVGSRQAVTASLTSFIEMCDRRGWRPVFYAVTDSFRKLMAKQGYKSIVVGEDTVIDLPELAFSGKSWQSVRSAINQADKLGISMQAIRYEDAPVGLKDQLQAIAASWANDKSLPALEFTLGTLKEAADPEVIMHIAIDSEGTVHGMTSWMPVYGKGEIAGWTIDIMQRRLSDDTMKGVIEYLIAESAMAFKQEGYKFISLSASPLSHGAAKTGPIEALLDMLAKRLEPYYGFKSLHNFKSKFKPHFEPMYMCYKDEAQLPAISIALTKAYMPDRALRSVIKSKIK